MQSSLFYFLQILACAPSNIAVDNIVERLVQHNIKVVVMENKKNVNFYINYAQRLPVLILYLL